MDRYEKLFALIAVEHPSAVLLGGDLLPSAYFAWSSRHDFVGDFLAPRLEHLRKTLRQFYPAVFLILGNDDPKIEEQAFLDFAEKGLWYYIHGRKAALGRFALYGYAYVPPTPFLLKDWERYDVSRYVDPGCISPEEGRRSVAVEEGEAKWRTIERDLADLAKEENLDEAVFLMHTPPYDTPLDRAALDGRQYEHVPLDVHIGSIAVRRFIERRQPLLTLHGHVHESTRLTGQWKARVGRTVCINGAHDGPELAVVRFDPEAPEHATRELI